MAELVKLAIENPLGCIVTVLCSGMLFVMSGLFEVKTVIAGIEKQQINSEVTDQRVYDMSLDVTWIKSHLETKEKQNESEIKFNI